MTTNGRHGGPRSGRTATPAITLGVDVFTTGQVAQFCGVAPRTVVKWCDAGLVKHYRIPRSLDRRIDRDSLIAFLREHKMPSRLDTPPTLLAVGMEPGPLAKLRDALPDDWQVIHSPDGFHAGIEYERHEPAAVVIDFLAGRTEALAMASYLRRAETRAVLVGITTEDRPDAASLCPPFDVVRVAPADPAALARACVGEGHRL